VRSTACVLEQFVVILPPCPVLSSLPIGSIQADSHYQGVHDGQYGINAFLRQDHQMAFITIEGYPDTPMELGAPMLAET
jgi:hypothetical protein